VIEIQNYLRPGNWSAKLNRSLVLSFFSVVLMASSGAVATANTVVISLDLFYSDSNSDLLVDTAGSGSWQLTLFTGTDVILGNVAATGLDLGDLTISWNTSLGQPLQTVAVEYVYVPEPATLVLALSVSAECWLVDVVELLKADGLKLEADFGLT